MTKNVVPRFKVVSWTILGALALGGCGKADPEEGDREAEAQQSAVFQDGVSPSGYAGTRDTFLREETPSQNNGDASILRVDGDSTNGKDLSALLRFELSSIPRDAIVRSVKLTVDVENATAGAAYEIYALKRSWGENTATWTSAGTGSAWAGAGAKSSTDRDWTVLGSIAATGAGKITITLNAAGIARVQQWLADPATNYGLIIADANNGDGLAFASRESSTASSRPKLAVTYDRPSTSTDAGTDTGGDTGVSDTGVATDADASTCVAQFPGDPRCTNKIYYGAAVEGGDPSTLETKVGRKIAVYRSFFAGDDAASKLVTRATTDLANDRLPLISTKLPGTWAEVAAGTHDAWLLERIRGLATVSGPVFFTLHHEPTGDGPPADWVKMQQHARKLIDANATNIVLVGVLNGWEFIKTDPHPEVFNHPVGSGVHIMGFDSYNPWSQTNGKKWLPAETVFSPGVVIQSWGYPTLVAEYGVRNDPANPGKAAQWMRDAWTYAYSNHFIGISYFDSGQNSPDGTWVMDGERLAVFKELLARPEVARP